MKKGTAANYIFIMTAIILWGMSFIWSDQLIDMEIPIFTFIFIRMVMAGVLMTVFSLLTGKLQKIQNGDLKWFLLMVFFEPFIYFIGESFGLKITGSPTLTAVVIATIPVFSLIVGRIVFKERLSLFNRSGIFVTLAGVLLFIFCTGEIHTEYLYGILVLLLAVVGSTGYSAVCKHLTVKYNSFTIVTYQFVFASVFFLVPFLIWGLPQWNPSVLSFRALKPIVELAVLCSCLSFVLYVYCIDKIGMTKSVIFTSLIPIFSALGAFLLGEDSFLPLQIVGIVVAIAGVIMAQVKVRGLRG